MRMRDIPGSEPRGPQRFLHGSQIRHRRRDGTEGIRVLILVIANEQGSPAGQWGGGKWETPGKQNQGEQFHNRRRWMVVLITYWHRMWKTEWKCFPHRFHLRWAAVPWKKRKGVCTHQEHRPPACSFLSWCQVLSVRALFWKLTGQRPVLLWWEKISFFPRPLGAVEMEPMRPHPAPVNPTQNQSKNPP